MIPFMIKVVFQNDFFFFFPDCQLDCSINSSGLYSVDSLPVAFFFFF